MRAETVTETVAEMRSEIIHSLVTRRIPEKAFSEQVQKDCADASGRIAGACYIDVLMVHPWRSCYEKQFGPVEQLQP